MFGMGNGKRGRGRPRRICMNKLDEQGVCVLMEHGDKVMFNL